jgi:hypothetical protein
MVHGTQDLIPWVLQAITQTVSPKPIVWIDAANKFNAHWVALNARGHCKDVHDVLRSYVVARPFTAYQLEAMVTQTLAKAAVSHKAILSVIADPLNLYVGAEGRDTQVRQSFNRFVRGLLAVSACRPLLLLVPEPSLQRYLDALSNIATSRIRMCKTPEGLALQEA